MKECFCCGEMKPLTEYYKHPQMGDGHLGKCKVCVRAYQKDRRYDPEMGPKVREYDRMRYRQPARRAAQYASGRTYKFRHPEKYRAHLAVGNAVRDGRLKRQPCEICGCEKAEAHHDDYSKPLEVRWLCKPHHEAVHHNLPLC